MDDDQGVRGPIVVAGIGLFVIVFLAFGLLLTWPVIQNADERDQLRDARGEPPAAMPP